jgi:ribosome-binding factor A
MERFVKWQKRRNRTAESVDPEFAEALLSNSSERSSSDRKVLRKTQQLCRQVQRALNMALASGDSQLQDCEIFVEEVSPAPDCGHLLAHVVVSEGRIISEAMTWLRQNQPRLRTEVAMSISRKRAPELAFVPAFTAAGEND